MPKPGYFTPTLDELDCADIRDYYVLNRIRLRRKGIRSEAAFITILLQKGFRYFGKEQYVQRKQSRYFKK